MIFYLVLSIHFNLSKSNSLFIFHTLSNFGFFILADIIGLIKDEINGNLVKSLLLIKGAMNEHTPIQISIIYLLLLHIFCIPFSALLTFGTTTSLRNDETFLRFVFRYMSSQASEAQRVLYKIQSHFFYQSVLFF